MALPVSHDTYEEPPDTLNSADTGLTLPAVRNGTPGQPNPDSCLWLRKGPAWTLSATRSLPRTCFPPPPLPAWGNGNENHSPLPVWPALHPYSATCWLSVPGGVIASDLGAVPSSL